MHKLSTLIEGEYSLSITEQRVLHLACKQIRSTYMKMNIKPSEIKKAYEEHNFEIARVYVLDFKNEYKVKGNNLYISLVETTEKLDKATIKIVKEDGTSEEVKIGAFEYIKNERCIDIMLNPEVLMLFLALGERYGKFKYAASKNFKKMYSYRLYDIAKDTLEKKGYRHFSLDEMKNKLGLDSTKYEDCYELKRNVLKPSIAEIEKSTDLRIRIQDKVKIKKIIGFTLNVSSIPVDDSTIEKDLIPELTQEELDRINLTARLNLTMDQAENLVRIVILTIVENEVDKGFYDYIKELRECGIIFTLIKNM